MTIAAAAVWPGGCSPDAAQPVPVALAELVADQELHDGQYVVTDGTVRPYEQPRHYWIEDPTLNRVELVPPEVAADHVGAYVQVEGHFTFRDDEGRRIEVDGLEVLDVAPQARTVAAG